MKVVTLATEEAFDLIDAHGQTGETTQMGGIFFVTCKDQVKGDYIVFTTADGLAGQILPPERQIVQVSELTSSPGFL